MPRASFLLPDWISPAIPCCANPMASLPNVAPTMPTSASSLLVMGNIWRASLSHFCFTLARHDSGNQL